jgi:hypothetical protein
MSSHPNVLLIAVLKPANTSRKTMRDILAEAGCEGDIDDIDPVTGKKIAFHPNDGAAEIGLRHFVCEGSYDDGWQISADEGDLVFFDMITYGYGEFISWDVLAEQKEMLAKWCSGVCERHNCTFEIRVSANHW